MRTSPRSADSSSASPGPSTSTTKTVLRTHDSEPRWVITVTRSEVFSRAWITPRHAISARTPASGWRAVRRALTAGRPTTNPRATASTESPSARPIEGITASSSRTGYVAGRVSA